MQSRPCMMYCSSHIAIWNPNILHRLQYHVFPGLDLYYGCRSCTTSHSGRWGRFLSSQICSPLKRCLSVRSHELLPRKCCTLVFLTSEWVGAFSKIYSELFPASQGPSCKKSRLALFRSNWVKYDYNPRSDRKNTFFFDRMDDCNRIWRGWIEKVLKVTACNWAPGEAGNRSG